MKTNTGASRLFHRLEGRDINKMNCFKYLITPLVHEKLEQFYDMLSEATDSDKEDNKKN